MLILSPVLSKASGSLAGLVAGHNKGGMYFRQRSTPINPITSFQQVVRNALKLLSADWSNLLTAAQRVGWNTYAVNQPLTNVFGESKQIPPLAHFIRSNTSRIQAALAQVNVAPTTFTLPTFTDPVGTLTASTDSLSMAFTNTDGWAGEIGGGMMIYASRPQSAGIAYFKGPYRFAGVISGAVVPPTTPVAFVLPFNYAVGNRCFLRVRVSRADGRLSTDRFYTLLAV